MLNTLTALLVVLAYGIVVGAGGLLLAFRERNSRRKMVAEHTSSALSQTLHGRLRTDSGQELEVYLQSAGR